MPRLCFRSPKLILLAKSQRTTLRVHAPSVASRQGGRAGCPCEGKSASKTSSVKSLSSSSATRRYRLPLGNAARAPSVGSGLFQTSPSVSLLVSRGGALLAGLPDHLGRLEEERRRKRQPKSLSGAEVEDELEVYGPLHREVGRFGALQNLVHIASGAPKQVR